MWLGHGRHTNLIPVGTSDNMRISTPKNGGMGGGSIYARLNHIFDAHGLWRFFYSLTSSIYLYTQVTVMVLCLHWWHAYKSLCNINTIINGMGRLTGRILLNFFFLHLWKCHDDSTKTLVLTKINSYNRNSYLVLHLFKL